MTAATAAVLCVSVLSVTFGIIAVVTVRGVVEAARIRNSKETRKV
jgi:hypothetical protein